MATNLDLEEQEQLDQLKHFWRAYGTLITWAVILVLAAFLGWNRWQWWQDGQANKAGVMFDEVERVVRANDADRAGSLFAEIKERYPRTLYAAQAGLLTAKAQLDKGEKEAAQTTLQWVADSASEKEYRAIARLRLAGLLMDEKKFDDALKLLDGEWPKSFQALATDRRGDVLVAQGKKDDAIAAFRSAYQGLDERLDYRRLVDAKLTALGASPVAPAAAASAPSAGASK